MTPFSPEFDAIVVRSISSELPATTRRAGPTLFTITHSRRTPVTKENDSLVVSSAPSPARPFPWMRHRSISSVPRARRTSTRSFPKNRTSRRTVDAESDAKRTSPFQLPSNSTSSIVRCCEEISAASDP